ncbi:MAG TPA: endonuclease/exonuclease/phosphatase family protein [Bryobacteraceae bacterium]|nr:endonuclease/exonuclease/phosphatase family protein [Bryobacteraceae bacterium]
MKLLAWNIQHGGGNRIEKLCSALIAHNPDIIALTEFRTKPGARIVSALSEAGWVYSAGTDPMGSDNGICVLSRNPLLRGVSAELPKENSARWLNLELPSHGMGFAAVHVLTSVPGSSHPPGVAKARFWDAILRSALNRREEPFMFIGDFNTGRHQHDELGKTFVCAEHFERLTASGWIDAWRHINGAGLEATWYSRLPGGCRGNPFRLDHAFVSPALLPRLRNCYYSHTEREAGISDHSMIVVEFNDY